MSLNQPALSLARCDSYWRGSFLAMGSPCEVLMSVDEKSLAEHLLTMACHEAKRIEHKFSRYRDDNIIYRINHANGQAVEVDEETADLLDFADQCYALSEGRFDITSGVLRDAWHFDGSDNIPSKKAVETLMSRVGWGKVTWQRPVITLKPGMEVDLGGIGKEYAVDHTAKLLSRETSASILVNYGGDLFATGPQDDGQPWGIGVDDPHHTGERQVVGLHLRRGGMATSGDARRYLLKDGVRYSHILDPRTGWPVPDAPRAVTVVANTCIEAGMMSTFAMLYGAQARDFLEAQGVQFWCI